jgi:hypothetical protein
MVIVQEDDELHEHIIYYHSRNLIGPELNYSHIENLALVAIQFVVAFLNQFQLPICYDASLKLL